MSRNNQHKDNNNRTHQQNNQNYSEQNPNKMTEKSNSTNKNTENQPLQKDFRILRCFCGCSQLTYEQIETLTMMNVHGLIDNQLGNKLLKTFLKIGHRSDKSNALLLLECCEICDRTLSDLSSYEDYIDDIFEVCPSFIWEHRINAACEDDNIECELKEVLEALKKECISNIECDNDFSRFRRELLRKIGK